MSKNEDQKDKKQTCPCGCEQVMLTEEINAPKRCAGCGKPVK